MKEYTINFVIWFYAYKVKDFALYVRNQAWYILVLTRTLPMILYFFTPIFGNRTPWGWFMSIFIRFWWALFGLIISIAYILPFVAAWVAFVMLPVVPIIQIVRFVT